MEKKRYSLFLDDIRQPKTTRDWLIARSVYEAKAIIAKMGMPLYISFDHDLGENEPSGYDLAKWIVNECLEGRLKLPIGFDFNVHSANPIGAQNIEGLLRAFLKNS